jgi:hypothetical protein
LRAAGQGAWDARSCHRDRIGASVAPGESLNAEGIWHNDRQHGRLQFKANDLRQVPPSTAEGIERSIKLGMVKDIGPHFAKTWVRAFGDAVFEIIEPHPERLLELAGIFGALTNSFSATGWEAVRPRQPRCTPHLRADGL